jgi:hypothetical protein
MDTICIRKIRVVPVMFGSAKAFYERYEHLGNCGLGVWHWGGYADGRLVGVVSFGNTCFASRRGHLAAIAARFDLSLFQLCRGGTIPFAPRNTPSYILGAALCELRRQQGDCLVVGYADRRFNEIGTIYQACNAIYTGKTDAKNQSNYVIRGKAMTGWVVRKRFGTRAMEVLRKFDKKVTKIPLTSKYRYVFVLTSSRKRVQVLKALEPVILPYPNRQEENIASMKIQRLIDARAAQPSGFDALPTDF